MFPDWLLIVTSMVISVSIDVTLWGLFTLLRRFIKLPHFKKKASSNKVIEGFLRDSLITTSSKKEFYFISELKGRSRTLCRSYVKNLNYFV